MGLITRRPQFIVDLRDAWAFIARDSQQRAEQFVLELEQRR
jgi:hypothetical protein